MKFNEYKQVEDQYKIGGGNAGFMKLEEGENNVRIVSEFEVRGIHQFKNEKGKFESRVCIGKAKGCVYCNADSKITVKYLGWVIDTKDGKFKLLEIGHTIFKQLGEFQNDPDYTFESIPDYNIKIKRSGKGLDTEYQVIPSPKRSALEKDTLEEVAKLRPIAEIIKAMKEKELKYLQENYPTGKIEENIPVIEEGNESIFPNDKAEDIDVKDIPF
jgi:hypothetical protein